MQAHKCCILPGHSDFGTEINQRRNSRLYTDRKIRIFRKDGLKFLCSAVKADITRLQKNNLFIFRVRLQILVNLFRAVFCKHWLLIFFYCFCHASRTDQHIRLLTRVYERQRHLCFCTRSDSGDHDVPFHGQIKFFNEIPLDLVLRESFFLFRTADQNDTDTGLFCCLNFFFKAAVSSGFLRYHPFGMERLQHCNVHVHRKRSLHAYGMCGIKSKFRAGCNYAWQRQHPGIHTVFIIRKLCKFCEFLASCCHQNLSLCARQIRYRFFCRVDHDAGWICRKRRPQQPKVRFSCFFTCRPDIFRHKIGIRMGCIDNHFRLFFAKKLFHLFFCQSSASNRQGTALLDPALAVFCRRTGKGCNLIFLQKTADLPAFRRSGKDDYFIHSDIPSALPCDPGFPLSDCFR